MTRSGEGKQSGLMESVKITGLFILVGGLLQKLEIIIEKVYLNQRYVIVPVNRLRVFRMVYYPLNIAVFTDMRVSQVCNSKPDDHVWRMAKCTVNSCNDPS